MKEKIKTVYKDKVLRYKKRAKLNNEGKEVK
jgi:hypothetical protein